VLRGRGANCSDGGAAEEHVGYGARPQSTQRASSAAMIQCGVGARYKCRSGTQARRS
jgi:hypothetical protein